MAEIQFHLERLQPHFVILQETWLEASIESIIIPNYILVSRKDRSEHSNRGGIAAFARRDVSNIVLIEESIYAERAWHLLHTDVGTIAIVNWYRPGSSPITHITSFREEFAQHAHEFQSIVVAGDLNIHHRSWLLFSNGNTIEGDIMKTMCDDLCLRQVVRAPTRNEYLLDLCLTDIENVKVSIEPSISDHKALMIRVPIHAEKYFAVSREVWHYRGATWHALKQELSQWNWQCLDYGSVDCAANMFIDVVSSLIAKHIPRKTITIEKSTCPWLSSRCRDAIEAKNAAEHSSAFEAARDHCAQVIAEEHVAYKKKLREKLAELPRGCKQWWKIVRELQNNKARVSSIPPLKDEHGKWQLSSKDKANLLAHTWHGKCILPQEVDMQYFSTPNVELDSFVALRSRCTYKLLLCLDDKKATGPDKISAFILKELARELAIPLTILCRRMLHEGVWPEQWKTHYVVPIYKKSSVYNPTNYRGVHLTSILSKVAERLIGAPLIAHLSANHFGANQWAFTKQRSARDLSTLCICT